MRLAMGLGCLVLAVGCVGELSLPGQGPDSAQQELVENKTAWLQAYDGHCDECFEGFRQCRQAAASIEELSNCGSELRACVRDGVDQSTDELEADEPPGLDDEGDEPLDGEGEEPVDVDDNDDDGANEGGNPVGGDEVDPETGQDIDTGADDDDDPAPELDPEAEPVADPEADPEPVIDTEDPKAELRAGIQACLQEGRACLESPDTDALQCLGELRSCVKDVLTTAFEGVCERVQAQDLPERVAAKVGRLCDAGPGLAP